MMKTSIIPCALIGLLFLVNNSEALNCYACVGATCNTPTSFTCPAGSIFCTSVTVSSGGVQTSFKSCSQQCTIPPTQGSTAAILCCNTDNCNNNAVPVIGTTAAPITLAPTTTIAGAKDPLCNICETDTCKNSGFKQVGSAIKVLVFTSLISVILVY